MKDQYLIKIFNRSWKQGSDKLEGGSREAVGSAGISVDVVAGEVSHVLQNLG